MINDHIYMCMIYGWVAYRPKGFRGLSSTLRSSVRFRPRFPLDTHLHASGGKPRATPSITLHIDGNEGTWTARGPL